nr:unnamed protein product [Callosobruchus chinensis]
MVMNILIVRAIKTLKYRPLSTQMSGLQSYSLNGQDMSTIQGFGATQKFKP